MKTNNRKSIVKGAGYFLTQQQMAEARRIEAATNGWNKRNGKKSGVHLVQCGCGCGVFASSSH